MSSTAKRRFSWHDMPHAERRRRAQLLAWRIEAEYREKIKRHGITQPAVPMGSPLMLLAEAQAHR